MKITSNNIISLTEGQIATLTLAHITDIHNQMCEVLGLKPTKRFGTKPAAVKKTLKVQAEYIAHQKEQEAKKENFKNRKVEKSTVGKYTNTSILKLDSEATAGTAMGLITDFIKSKGGEAEAREVILHFVANYEQKRGKAEVDVPYARGYVTGAIRKGHISVK